MVKDIPEDVLRQIFLTLYLSTASDIYKPTALWDGVSVEPTGPSAREVVAYTLSAVCRTWRAVVRETSHLWTDVSYGSSRYENDATSLDELSQSLGLSGVRLVGVRLTLARTNSTASGVGLNLPFSLLLSHLHRIDRLVIVVDQPCPPLGQLLTNGKNLAYVRDEFQPQFKWKARTLFLGPPAHLLPRDQPLTGLPTSNLRSLVLHHVAFNCVTDLAFFLRNCMYLNALTLLGTNEMVRNEAFASVTHCFSFPILDLLTIDCDHLQLLTQLGLKTPSLRILEVYKLESQQDFSHGIDWYFAKTIEHLTFVRGWTDHEINFVLPVMDRLRTLRLVCCRAGRCLMHRLCRESPLFPSGPRFWVPKLKDLVIDSGELDDDDINLLLDVRDSRKHPDLETLNFDLFLCINVSPSMFESLERTGRGTGRPFPHPKGKAFERKEFVTLDEDVFPPPCAC